MNASRSQFGVGRCAESLFQEWKGGSPGGVISAIEIEILNASGEPSIFFDCKTAEVALHDSHGNQSGTLAFAPRTSSAKNASPCRILQSNILHENIR